MLENETGLAHETARAMRELARTVTGAPPLRLAPRPGVRAGRAARARRWTLWAGPLTAAVAVIAIALALVTIRSFPGTRTTRPSVPSHPSVVPSYLSAAGVPRYYVAPQVICTTTCDPTRLVVGQTLTGTRLAILSPPRGTTFGTVSAAADDRTFVTDTVRFPRPAQTPEQVTWYRITITPGSSSPARLTRLPVPAEPTGEYVQAVALSPSGRELAVLSYRERIIRAATPPIPMGGGQQGTTVLRIYSLATGQMRHSWSTGTQVSFTYNTGFFDGTNYTVGSPGYVSQSNSELSWIDGDRAITFTTFSFPLKSIASLPGKTTAKGTFPFYGVRVRVLDVTTSGSDLIEQSRVAWSAGLAGSPHSPACGAVGSPALAADGRTILCTDLSSTPAGTGNQARASWQKTWLAFPAAAPKVIRALYTATASGPANASEPVITGGVLWADPSGATLIIAWSSDVADSKATHFGMLSHGKLTPLPLPSTGPLAVSSLPGDWPGIAW